MNIECGGNVIPSKEGIRAQDSTFPLSQSHRFPFKMGMTANAPIYIMGNRISYPELTLFILELILLLRNTI